jgi:hypothetical protein
MTAVGRTLRSLDLTDALERISDTTSGVVTEHKDLNETLGAKPSWYAQVTPAEGTEAMNLASRE